MRIAPPGGRASPPSARGDREPSTEGETPSLPGKSNGVQRKPAMQTRSSFPNPGTAWLLIVPTLFVLAVFLYYPALQTLKLSFYRVGFLGLTSEFTGLKNYVDLFTDPYYRRIFLNTAIFAGSTVVLSMVCGLGLALLANQKVTGWRVYRLLLIWPYALPPAVGGVIILFMVNSQAGILNYFLDSLLGIRPDWLINPKLAMAVTIVASVWKNIGYNVVFYLAALQNLPGEVLEAALIDGAGPWKRFWKITLPLLSPMTLFLLVVNTIYAFFDTFAFIDLLTKGGPAEATTILIYSIYRDGFQYFKTGFAAAQSVVLFVVVVGLTVLQFRFSGKMVHYGG